MNTLIKNRKKIYYLIKWLSVLGFICSCILLFLAYREGFLTDTARLQAFIYKGGWLGPMIFMALQVIQVAIPIFPGGISTIAGDMIFGHIWGFVYNYIGICIGSFIGFSLVKIHGKAVLQLFFSSDTIARYKKRLSDDNKFLKFFAFMIFIPLAPDDFLCWLAGTTHMTYKAFILIILLCKPFAILTYSIGGATLIKYLLHLL